MKPHSRSPGAGSREVRAAGPSLSRKIGLGILILILLLEVLPRIWPALDPVLLPPTRLSDILRLFEQDEILFWRLRPGQETMFQSGLVSVNSLAFRGPEVAMPKPAGVFRILVLGESLTFGWGVEYEETYGQRLREALEERGLFGGRVEVVIAATPGYTSHQGLLLLERTGFSLQPDLVTVPYVVNDVDRLRFFRNDGRPDHELEPGSPFWIGLQNLTARSYSYRLYQRLIIGALKAIVGPKLRAQAMARGYVNRVPIDRYRANLERFQSLCSQHGVPLVFLRIPLHLPVPTVEDAPADLVPVLAAVADGATTLQPDKADRVLAWVKEQLQQALDAAINGDDPEEIEEQIELARQWDAYRTRIENIRYNAVMVDTAARLGVPLADVTSAVAAYHGEEPLFRDAADDPIHPSPLGHRLFAEVLLQTILDAGLN
jgi:lysophospholipase L1-like esterase